MVSLGQATDAAPVTWRGRLKNFGASLFFILCAYFIYYFAPHSAGLLAFTNLSIGLTGSDILTGACIAYSLLLLFYYLFEKDPAPSKSIAALRGLRALLINPAGVWRNGLPREERLGLLTVALKGFFAPIMLLSLFQFTTVMIANGRAVFLNSHLITEDFLLLFNAHGFWFLFQVILFLDVFLFTMGYLIEHPSLKNQIRSVDPTLAGWVVALACYPPFNRITERILGGNISDFPQFENPVVHVAMNVGMLFLMAVYASASVALNFKASNLTHRGIVAWGPYRLVRHPAYAAKNIAWWIGSMPALAMAWRESWWMLVLAISSVIGWTALYVLRALTEESHLRSVDGDYHAYCIKVRYRFIPGVI